jgi:GNAT superfamily N-acetyltransferase
MNVAAVDGAFRQWLAKMMPAGIYHAWLIETDAADVAAGGGAALLPWPPGPRDLHERLAFVYNVYTEPAHRRHGLARMVMTAIHDWCRGNDVGMVGLNASTDGHGLYASMGYTLAPAPMMCLALAPAPGGPTLS